MLKSKSSIMSSAIALKIRNSNWWIILKLKLFFRRIKSIWREVINCLQEFQENCNLEYLLIVCRRRLKNSLILEKISSSGRISSTAIPSKITSPKNRKNDSSTMIIHWQMNKIVLLLNQYLDPLKVWKDSSALRFPPDRYPPYPAPSISSILFSRLPITERSCLELVSTISSWLLKKSMH